jgi:aryl-alcohol dehydrogenase-like predicted oxidoreductase
MALPTRPLGKTGMDITRVGFGAWAAGGGGGRHGDRGLLGRVDEIAEAIVSSGAGEGPERP